MLRLLRSFGVSDIDGRRRRWIVRLLVGPGAGYVTPRLRVRGWTLWIGRRCYRGASDRRERWTCGATRNANRVPLVRS